MLPPWRRTKLVLISEDIKQFSNYVSLTREEEYARHSMIQRIETIVETLFKNQPKTRTKIVTSFDSQFSGFRGNINVVISFHPKPVLGKKRKYAANQPMYPCKQPKSMKAPNRGVVELDSDGDTALPIPGTESRSSTDTIRLNGYIKTKRLRRTKKALRENGFRVEFIPGKKLLVIEDPTTSIQISLGIRKENHSQNRISKQLYCLYQERFRCLVLILCELLYQHEMATRARIGMDGYGLDLLVGRFLQHCDRLKLDGTLWEYIYGFFHFYSNPSNLSPHMTTHLHITSNKTHVEKKYFTTIKLTKLLDLFQDSFAKMKVFLTQTGTPMESVLGEILNLNQLQEDRTRCMYSSANPVKF